MADSRRSGWDLFRKRIAPVALVLALVLLASQTCGSEVADVELRLDPGAAAGEVRALRVTVHRGDEAGSVGYFERAAGAAPGPAIWKLQLDPGSYRLAFAVTARDGRLIRFDRRFEARANARVTVDFARNLEQ